MSKLIVEGGHTLFGTVKIDTAKNAILPIIAATLLTDCECELDDISALDDVYTMIEVIKSVGAGVSYKDGKLIIRCKSFNNLRPPYELISKMRASILISGPILTRAGSIEISQPGGCAIGTRPIDLHLKGFSAMGAKINLGHGYIDASANELFGDTIYLDYPSVGATENIMMAATLAKGITTIENAAQEPEIVDLANFLNKMGANVKGAGTDIIRIEGVSKLHGAKHTPIPDRIEAGTYMAAAAATRGDVLIDCIIPEHIRPMISKLREIGVSVVEYERAVRISVEKDLKAADIKTMPYPGFPTDLQAQMMALLCGVDGVSIICETVFENRFMHIGELKRMGAKIKIQSSCAVIHGKKNLLTGSKVRCSDLRAGAALIIAALSAKGKSEISDIYHIDRGYVNIEQKLSELGANIYIED